jgi:DNA-binding transcriptional MerR regulator
MSQDYFYKSDVVKKTGLEPRTIQFYTERIGIEPDISRPKKKGSNRKYSRENLIEFLMVKELRKSNLSLAAIEKIIKFVREEGKGRKLKWWGEPVEKKQIEISEIAFCFVYEPFSPEKMDFEFNIIPKIAGHLYQGDGTPWTLQEYTREANGDKMVLIINLSNVLLDAVNGLKNN